MPEKNQDYTYPILYKTIPTQYAFLVSKSGKVKIRALRDLPAEKEFESEDEAREWIESLKSVL